MDGCEEGRLLMQRASTKMLYGCIGTIGIIGTFILCFVQVWSALICFYQWLSTYEVCLANSFIIAALCLLAKPLSLSPTTEKVHRPGRRRSISRPGPCSRLDQPSGSGPYNFFYILYVYLQYQQYLLAVSWCFRLLPAPAHVLVLLVFMVQVYVQSFTYGQVVRQGGRGSGGQRVNIACVGGGGLTESAESTQL